MHIKRYNTVKAYLWILTYGTKSHYSLSALQLGRFLKTCFRHSDELIGRLENAGLGYHVDADKTTDKLGKKIFYA